MHVDTSRRKATARLTDPADHPDGKFLLFEANHNRIMKAYTAELTIAEHTGSAIVRTTHLYGDNPHTVRVDPHPTGRYSAARFEQFAMQSYWRLLDAAGPLHEQLATEPATI